MAVRPSVGKSRTSTAVHDAGLLIQLDQSVGTCLEVKVVFLAQEAIGYFFGSASKIFHWRYWPC